MFELIPLHHIWLNLANGLKTYYGGEKETGKHGESIVIKNLFPSGDGGNS